MDFAFSNLLGAPYRGGNLVFAGTTLLSCVGSRVQETDLAGASSSTLPCEAQRPLQCLAAAPGGAQLLAFDDEGRGLLINRRRRVILHRMRFKVRNRLYVSLSLVPAPTAVTLLSLNLLRPLCASLPRAGQAPVACARFSPCGRFFAVAVGRLMQVWATPQLSKQFAPFRLHRTYGGAFDNVSCLAWSADSAWLATGSRDLAARVLTREPIPGYVPPMLSGHREPLAGVFFAGASPRELITVSRDGALFYWTREASPGEVPGGSLAHGAAPENDDGSAAAAAGPLSRGAPGPAGGAGGKGRVAAMGSWVLAAKHFFLQREAKLTCVMQELAKYRALRELQTRQPPAFQTEHLHLWML